MALCICGPGPGLSLLLLLVALGVLTGAVWAIVALSSWLVRSMWPERPVDGDRPSPGV
jgi:hypothetical protein